jgi:hypothetical protein
VSREHCDPRPAVSRVRARSGRRRSRPVMRTDPADTGRFASISARRVLAPSFSARNFSARSSAAASGPKS